VDFLKASRFQWSDLSLEIATHVRKAFDKTKYLADPRDKAHRIATFLKRPTIKSMLASDPSEAADSERIIAAVLNYFPDAEITKTGGTIYNLVLSDMLHNFDEDRKDDQLLLELLMIIDELCVKLGETQYATALAIKE